MPSVMIEKKICNPFTILKCMNRTTSELFESSYNLYFFIFILNISRSKIFMERVWCVIIIRWYNYNNLLHHDYHLLSYPFCNKDIIPVLSNGFLKQTLGNKNLCQTQILHFSLEVICIFMIIKSTGMEVRLLLCYKKENAKVSIRFTIRNLFQLWIRCTLQSPYLI